jgi:hypothetical protein
VACNPLNIQTGLFLTGTMWSNAPNASFDGKTLTYAAGGANPGITVQQGANSVFHACSRSTSSWRLNISPGMELSVLEVSPRSGPLVTWTMGRIHSLRR